MSELIVFVGLQGAGKSTFHRERFATTHALVSKDLLHHRHKQRRQMELLTEHLAAGRSVVVDNTNPTVADRAPLIELGHTFGTKMIGYYFATPLALCLQRNRDRVGDARVPDVAIYATRKHLVPPSYGEGFDLLYRVGLDAAGQVELQVMERTGPLPIADGENEKRG